MRPTINEWWPKNVCQFFWHFEQHSTCTFPILPSSKSTLFCRILPTMILFTWVSWGSVKCESEIIVAMAWLTRQFSLHCSCRHVAIYFCGDAYIFIWPDIFCASLSSLLWVCMYVYMHFKNSTWFFKWPNHLPCNYCLTADIELFSKINLEPDET